MVKVTMAHPFLLRFAILLVVSSFVQSQLFVHSPIRPVFFLHRPNNRNVQANLPERAYQNSQNHPIARSDLVSSEEDQNDADATSSEASFEKRNETQLSDDFDRSVRANRPPLEPRPSPPMYGDPAVMEDEDAEQDRSRFLWPFSTTVTVAKSKAHPPHHHHLSYPPGFPKPPLLPPHLQQQHHHHDHHDLEYEKTRLKYEIYKLKAKKTIAILQNKVELKKILSLLLQQKIKALEWITWYHDYVEQMYNQANGWDSGDGDGWDGDVKPLTDEEILHSKGSSSSKSSKWSSVFGGGILSRLRSSLSFPNNQKGADKQEVLPQHIIPKQPYHPPKQQIPPQPQQQLERVSLQSQQHQSHTLHNLPPQKTKPLEQKKPFLQNLFGRSTLLKYIGLGNKQKLETFHKLNRPPVEKDLRNEKPHKQSEEQSEEQEDQDEKPSNEDREDDKDDEDTNDDEDDPDDDKNEKSEEDEEGAGKESVNDKSFEPGKDKSKEQEDERSQEQETGKSQENDSKEQENGESDEKEDPAADGKSVEEGDNNKSEELDEKIQRISKDKFKIIDIDEELAQIEVPNKPNRLRTGNQPSQGFKPDLFPNKKEKKKKKFQDKVYSFLFKTMDVLDKHFMSDEEEEVLEA